jgi:hypothetical protein
MTHQALAKKSLLPRFDSGVRFGLDSTVASLR